MTDVVEESEGIQWSPSGEQRQITGRYHRFSSLLGKGAYKEVFASFDVERQIDVAWNQIDLSTISSDEDKRKIYNECDMLRRLDHPSILKIHNQWYNDQTDMLCFITDIIQTHQGASLAKYIKRRRINVGRVKEICRQILDALAYLHEQDPPVIHRDLKCDNIFIEASSGRVVIGDLGLSTQKPNSQIGPNPTMSVVGTPHWMAPECYTEQYNEKVDMWSFGMCVLEMVTGQIPYQECKTPPQVYKRVTGGQPPAILDQITDTYVRSFIKMCLVFQPELRPSAGELAEHPFCRFEQVYLDKKPCFTLMKNGKMNVIAEETPSRLAAPSKNARRPGATRRRKDVQVQSSVPKPDRTTKIKLQIYGSKNNKPMAVTFSFNQHSDTVEEVAAEMVRELRLGDDYHRKVQDGIRDALAGVTDQPRTGKIRRKNRHDTANKPTKIREGEPSMVIHPDAVSSRADGGEEEKVRFAQEGVLPRASPPPAPAGIVQSQSTVEVVEQKVRFRPEYATAAVSHSATPQKPSNGADIVTTVPQVRRDVVGAPLEEPMRYAHPHAAPSQAPASDLIPQPRAGDMNEIHSQAPMHSMNGAAVHPVTQYQPVSESSVTSWSQRLPPQPLDDPQSLHHAQSVPHLNRMPMTGAVPASGAMYNTQEYPHVLPAYPAASGFPPLPTEVKSMPSNHTRGQSLHNGPNGVPDPALSQSQSMHTSPPLSQPQQQPPSKLIQGRTSPPPPPGTMSRSTTAPVNNPGPAISNVAEEPPPATVVNIRNDVSSLQLPLDAKEMTVWQTVLDLSKEQLAHELRIRNEQFNPKEGHAILAKLLFNVVSKKLKKDLKEKQSRPGSSLQNGDGSATVLGKPPSPSSSVSGVPQGAHFIPNQAFPAENHFAVEPTSPPPVESQGAVMNRHVQSTGILSPNPLGYGSFPMFDQADGSNPAFPVNGHGAVYTSSLPMQNGHDTTPMQNGVHLQQHPGGAVPLFDPNVLSNGTTIDESRMTAVDFRALVELLNEDHVQYDLLDLREVLPLQRRLDLEQSVPADIANVLMMRKDEVELEFLTWLQTQTELQKLKVTQLESVRLGEDEAESEMDKKVQTASEQEYTQVKIKQKVTHQNTIKMKLDEIIDKFDQFVRQQTELVKLKKRAESRKVKKKYENGLVYDLSDVPPEYQEQLARKLDEKRRELMEEWMEFVTTHKQIFMLQSKRGPPVGGVPMATGMAQAASVSSVTSVTSAVYGNTAPGIPQHFSGAPPMSANPVIPRAESVGTEKSLSETSLVGIPPAPNPTVSRQSSRSSHHSVTPPQGEYGVSDVHPGL